MDLTIWYLKANAAFAVLFCAYLLALRQETWFAARRAWLLLSALLSLALPFLIPFAGTGPTLTVTIPTVIADSGATTLPSGMPWQTALVWVHLAIAAVLVARLIRRSWNSIRSVRGTGDEAASFFHIIHVPEQFDAQDKAAILAHERTHARQGHSFDVLGFELLSVFCWSNPLWRFALHELRLVHEHLADAAAAPSSDHYPELLLAHALGAPAAVIHNRFSPSNLKTRLLMLQNTRSPKRALPKLLWSVPVLLLAMAFTSAEVLPPINQPDEAIVFSGYDRPAEYPGGMDALMKFLSSKLVYPESAKKDGIEGSVHVSFTIKASGKVTGTAVKRGVRDDLDKESLRVVSAMPDWKPAMSKGKAVDSEMVLPISFKLPVK